MLFTWLKYISMSSKFKMIFIENIFVLYSCPRKCSFIWFFNFYHCCICWYFWHILLMEKNNWPLCHLFLATVCVCFVSTKLANKLLTVAALSSKSGFSPELPLLLHHKSYLFLWGLCCWCCWGHLVISVYFIVFFVIFESPWLSFFQLSFSSSLASFLGMALAVGFEKVERKFYQKEYSFSISWVALPVFHFPFPF